MLWQLVTETEPVVDAAFDLSRWEAFAVAVVGAAAALAGLLVVAVSINVARILELPAVISRLVGTLALFAGILAIGTVLLVPGQGVRWAGVEIVVIAVALLAALVRLKISTRSQKRYGAGTTIAEWIGIGAAAFLLAAGVTCLLSAGGGLYWLVPAVLVGFTIGLANAWVALVEILR